MKKVLFLFSACIAFILLISSQKATEVILLPKVQIRKNVAAEMEVLHTALHTFQHTLETQSSKEDIQRSFLELRKRFKSIEYIIAYADPQLYLTFLNGAPLPKVTKKVPELSIIEASGLQRMEEVIFGEEYSIALIEKYTTLFEQKLSSLSANGLKRSINDAFIFEAARFGLIRLNALGITGFDSPGNTDKAIDEARYSFNGICAGIDAYSQFMKADELEAFHALQKTGIQLLTHQKFESFNRFTFLQEVINPMWKLTLEIQRSLHIELPSQQVKQPIAVNYESENLFSDDFFNVAFYADFLDDPRLNKRIALGKLLFFDPALSGSNDRACASCHQPNKAFAENLTTSRVTNTLLPGLRNAPTILNSVYASRFFHDARAERLSQQMDHVVLNPDEFNTTYDKIALKLNGSSEYRSLFSEAYGALGITQYTITNSVSAYMSSLRSFNSEFDKYVRGESQRIDPAVIRGYNLFTGKAACATCHFAPTFNGVVPPDFIDTETEVLGVPTSSKRPFVLDDDMGRVRNGIIKEAAPFYARSFKTPTIRNIELTAPYMHNGAYKTLKQVIDFYDKGGGIGLGLDVPHQTLPSDALNLKRREKKDLIVFMQSLTDTSNFTTIPSSLPSFENHPVLNNREIGGVY